MSNQMKKCMKWVKEGFLEEAGVITEAGLEGCPGIPQKESRKGHSRQEGEDRHRPVSEPREMGGND